MVQLQYKLQVQKHGLSMLIRRMKLWKLFFFSLLHHLHLHHLLHLVVLFLHLYNSTILRVDIVQRYRVNHLL